jgi:hypothetical protein
MWATLEIVAWVISAIIFGWMLWDAIQVSRTHSEESLISSREGVDELFADRKEG